MIPVPWLKPLSVGDDSPQHAGVYDVVLCDTTFKMRSLLDELESLHYSRRVLYVDFEGINLSRYGKVCIGQLTYPASRTIYLLDFVVLVKELVLVRSSSGWCCLKEIFETTAWQKVWFDPRADVDALYHHFGVLPKNNKCLQLCEIAVRR